MDPIEHDPDVQTLLKAFNYAHLPENLQAISRPFHELADDLIHGTGVKSKFWAIDALKKLKDAKDSAVLAHLAP